MKRWGLVLLAALVAYPAFADCEVVQGDPVEFPTLIAAGECAVFDVRGLRSFTIETRPEAASSVLTFTGNSADADTFTIGATVYTTETGAVGTAYEVNDAASAALFIVNLCAAINADGAGDGSDYAAGTAAHPTVTCTASNATTLTVTAIAAGSGANTIATETTSMDAAWTGATLVDVVDPISTVSRVDSITAQEHGVVTNGTTGTVATAEVIAVDWPYILAACTAAGDCAYAGSR